MDLRDYVRKYGRKRLRAVAEQAGTSVAYLDQLVYGNRAPSFALAEKLVAVSLGELDLRDLMYARERIRAEREQLVEVQSSAYTPQGEG